MNIANDQKSFRCYRVIVWQQHCKDSSCHLKLYWIGNQLADVSTWFYTLVSWLWQVEQLATWLDTYNSLRPLGPTTWVPTKGACRVAELAFKRFLREQIRLTQRAKGDGKKETESIARSITAALFADEASEILEKIRVNTQRIFNTTKDRQQCKLLKLVHGKQASAVSNVDHHLKLTKTNW